MSRTTMGTERKETKTTSRQELLFRTIEERWRPEDVAALALELYPALGAQLSSAARHAAYGTGSWNPRYHAPGFATHSVNTSITGRYPGLVSDPEASVILLRAATGLVGNDLRDRLPTPLRKLAGITISRRQYNRQCRILLALERKIERSGERGAYVRWTRVAKSGWATDISLTDFLAMTPATRAFVAYYVARRQRQSVFSGSGQDKAWDTVCEKLRPMITPTFAVALAFHDEEILAALSNKARTTLLVTAYRELLGLAREMSKLWKALGADKTTMVVARGMNSSDWNTLAGAWNAIRAQWLALLFACGRESDLRTFLPGKAMRLMAADVAAWHRSKGSDEGPDVKLFQRLPLPWDVVTGRATCGHRRVWNAAKKAGVGANTWTMPREPQKPVRTKPTNFLVHGVSVGQDPELKRILQRAGWFSGKGIKSDVDGTIVERDRDGYALGAKMVA